MPKYTARRIRTRNIKRRATKKRGGMDPPPQRASSVSSYHSAPPTYNDTYLRLLAESPEMGTQSNGASSSNMGTQTNQNNIHDILRSNKEYGVYLYSNLKRCEKYGEEMRKYSESLRENIKICKDKYNKLHDKYNKPKNDRYDGKNNGMAYQWKYNGQKVLRTYNGHVWKNDGKDQVGNYMGKYNKATKILDTSAEEPEYENE